MPCEKPNLCAWVVLFDTACPIVWWKKGRESRKTRKTRRGRQEKEKKREKEGRKTEEKEEEKMSQTPLGGLYPPYIHLHPQIRYP